MKHKFLESHKEIMQALLDGKKLTAESQEFEYGDAYIYLDGEGYIVDETGTGFDFCELNHWVGELFIYENIKRG